MKEYGNRFFLGSCFHSEMEDDMNKNARKGLAFVLAVAMLISMSNVAALAEEKPNFTEETTFLFDGDQVTVREGKDTNYEVVIYDSSDTESEAAVTADTDGNMVYSVPEGSSGQLYVAIKKKGGSYVFQGTGNGAIVVKKEAVNDAVLYFNGLDLASSFTAPVTVNKDSAASCTFYIVDGTVNSLTDTAMNNDENHAENLAAENAVMKFKAGSNVVFDGSGTLNITANGKNGIKANNAMTVKGNITWNIEAQNHGISCENELIIQSGTFSVKALAGDGIKASTDDGQLGDVSILAGNYVIDAADDAIHADRVLTLGQQGAKNEDLSIAIESCVEGLEGATVNIYSGTYQVFSDDDSINAANSDLTGYTYEINIYDGDIYAASTAGDCLDSNGNITISGGQVIALGAISGREANSALDCDGTLSITAGTVLAIGSQEMAQTPEKGQNYVVWTAAGSSTAAAAGTGGNNRPGGNRPGGSRPGQGGAGQLSIGNGSKVTICDEKGTELFSITAAWLYEGSNGVNHVVFSDPGLTSGSVYTLQVTSEAGATEAPDDMPTPPSGEPGDMPTPPSGEPGDMPMGFYYGDVDGDHKIEAEDALKILMHVVKLQTITDGLSLDLADVDHDGEITEADALCTLQICVKIREAELMEMRF